MAGEPGLLVDGSEDGLLCSPSCWHMTTYSTLVVITLLNGLERCRALRRVRQRQTTASVWWQWK